MTPRVIPTSSAEWNSAEAKFLEYCKKHDTTPKDYAEKFRRNKAWVIESIIAGKFDESFFFRTREERYIDCINKFDSWLIENGINPETYESEYLHSKKSAAYILDVGGEWDEEFWLSKKDKVIPEMEDVKEFFKEQLLLRGLDWDTFNVKTHKRRSRALKEIQFNWAKVHEHKWYLDKILEPAFKETRSAQYLLDQARKVIPPGRTAGVGMIELGSKLKSAVKDFYPGGLAGLNKDLGLEPTFHIPDFDKARNSAPTRNEIKIEEINQKIDRICDHLNPARLQNLKDKLSALSLEADELQGVQENDEILSTLRSEIQASLSIQPGYLYFKKWTVDLNTWFKIGVTNSPNRRDSEQNVLPVPAETLCLVRLDTMDHARAAEKAFHKVLEKRRIRGAKNKELFQLSPPDYKAVMIVFGELVESFSQPDDA